MQVETKIFEVSMFIYIIVFHFVDIILIPFIFGEALIKKKKFVLNLKFVI
jgi:hypothetical protein